MKMETEVTLRVVVQEPPAGVDYALQKGHGNDYEVVNRQRSNGNDLVFEFTVGVKPGHDKEVPGFKGPFVQGRADENFFYLDIGTYAGQTGAAWSRRLKIPLSGITWKMINSDGILQAQVPGKAKDGGPSCAYEWRKRVSPGWSWQVTKQHKK